MHWLGLLKGGPGSGNFGHAGRPGEVGGSAPDDTPNSPRDVPAAPDNPKQSDLVKLGKYDDWSNVTGKRRVTLFHFSREDRTGTGLRREYAGSGGAGEEKRSFEYDKEGKLVSESAPVHAYMYGATREDVVPGSIMHKIETELNVIDVASPEYKDILERARKEAEETGRPHLALARVIAKREGYDALASTRQGLVQILRDVEPSELEVVGKESSSKGGSAKVSYALGPPHDSKFKETMQKKWDTKLAGLAKQGPEFELYSLQNVAADMVDRGMITKEDRHAVIGNLTGDDFKSVEDVNRKVEELKSKIKPSANKQDVDEIEKNFRYSITAGKSKEEIKEIYTEQLRELVKKSDKVAVRVPLDFVDNVVEDGRFKSQFETGTSSGLMDIDLRKHVEEQGFGVPRETEDEKRPIYGYMSNETGDHTNPSLEYYGGVAFILKDDVKDRSTVTFGDSLDRELPGSRIDKPELESARISEGIFSPESFGYIEAQVHGGLEFDDVEEVIFNRRTIGMVVESYDPRSGATGDAGSYDGFQGGKLLKRGTKVYIQGFDDNRKPIKIPLHEWVKSDDFTSVYYGSENGDAFMAHTEERYGK